MKAIVSKLCIILLIMIMPSMLGADDNKKIAGYDYTVLPKWCKAVVYLNVRKFVKSPFFQLTQNNDFKNAVEKLEQFGINIFEDIDSIIAGSSDFVSKNGPPDFVFILNMKCDQSKISAKITENNPEIRELTIGDYQVLKAKKSTIAFINGAMLITSPGKMQEALRLVNGKGNNVLKNPKLNPILNKLKRSDLCWGVHENSSLLKKQIKDNLKNNYSFQPIVKNRRYINAWFFSSSLRGKKAFLAFGVHCQNKKTSVKLTKLFQRLRPMFNMLLFDDAQKLKVMRKSMIPILYTGISAWDIKKLLENKTNNRD